MNLWRIKYCYTVVDQRAGSEQLPLLAVSIHRGVVRRDEITEALPRAEDLSNYKICKPGDLVLDRMRAFQGAIGVSRWRGVVSPDYLVLRPLDSVDAGYLHHLFRSSWFVGEMVSRLRGIGGVENGSVRTPRINPDDLGDIRAPFPSLLEQRRIATYLDGEVGRLNRLEAMQQRVLDLSSERIDSRLRSIIERSALTHGDGQDVVPLRRLLIKLRRPLVDDGETVTVYRDGQVSARSARRVAGYTDSASFEPQGQGVAVGDVVVHGLDGFAGAIGDSESEGNCSPVYHVCTPVDGDAAYYGRLLRVLALDGYLSLFGGSARERAVDFRNWDRFGSIPIPPAATNEQFEIGCSIRDVRPLRDEVRRFEKLLAERRQSLITAAVTGQFDASTASGVAR